MRALRASGVAGVDGWVGGCGGIPALGQNTLGIYMHQSPLSFVVPGVLISDRKRVKRKRKKKRKQRAKGKGERRKRTGVDDSIINTRALNYRWHSVRSRRRECGRRCDREKEREFIHSEVDSAIR